MLAISAYAGTYQYADKQLTDALIDSIKIEQKLGIMKPMKTASLKIIQTTYGEITL